MLVLVLCGGWVWHDAEALGRRATVGNGAISASSASSASFGRAKDVLRQISASGTLGWMFLFEALGQVGLIVASRRRVAAEDPWCGDLAEGLLRPRGLANGGGSGDIRGLSRLDAQRRCGEAMGLVSKLLVVHRARVLLPIPARGPGAGRRPVGLEHSTALQNVAVSLYGPQLAGAACYVTARRWPAKWYGAIVFLLCPFFAGGAMLSRFGDGVDREGDHALWGAVVLVMYMGPFTVYTLGEPHVQRWHLEVMSLFVWVMLAVLGRSMML